MSSMVVPNDGEIPRERSPHPLQELTLERDFESMGASGNKFHVELSNLKLVNSRGGSVMLRFNLSWFFHDEVHGWLGDCSMGCLAYRDRTGEIGWSNHKLSFGGAFSKSVHSPTKGFYNLVLGIIIASKFEEMLTVGTLERPETKKKQKEPRRQVRKFLNQQGEELDDAKNQGAESNTEEN